ncbi:hypothetical protein V3C99_014270 [Haemonchus contortus]|uniref:NIM-2 protein n=1 Tax=Haemonchus contortus TaxID=6289 RepID=A0A7I4YTM9_HAECO|nr:Protein F54D5.3 [Haemonchus contortus]
MFKEALIALCLGFAAATTCDSETTDGTWLFALDTSVASYAHGGEDLNPKYNCFEVTKDNTALQKFRVDLQKPFVVEPVKPLTQSGSPTSLRQMKARADANNEEYCVDKQLRADIAEAVKDAEDSCQGLVNALASKLNRPGWTMNCVTRSPNSFSLFFFAKDRNFCRYETVKGGKVYTLTLAKLDKSESGPKE